MQNPQIKICKQCNSNFEITDKDLEFYEKFSPVIWWKKYLIPLPDICPDCYEQLRLSFRNKRNLYRSKCDATGKDIISSYSPDKPYIIYEQSYWWSDKWDKNIFIQEYDCKKSFFTQLNDLILKYPFQNLSIVNCENSDYNDSLQNSKNAYMCSWSYNIENSYYIEESRLVKDSSDIWWSSEVEKSYECIDVANMYMCKYCYSCSNSSNILFCKKCNNCHDCFMCYALEWKQYNILNKQYSKEEYFQKLNQINLWNYSEVNKYFKIFKDFELTYPHKNLETFAVENCGWDYIYNSKNSINCFYLVWWEDCKNLYEWWRCSQVYDSSSIYDLEWPVIWSISVFKNCKNIYFSENVYDSSFNIFYSFNLKSCSNCFACVWLVWKQYCIFNKQYSQKNYLIELEKIINSMIINNEWWAPLSPLLSRFWYNETESQFYFPITNIQAKDKWFKWSNYERPPQNVTKIIPADKLPDNIKDIPDDIINRAIECSESKKAFRIVLPELQFFRENNIPIPRFHPDIRYKNRIKQKNPRKIYDRNCQKCWKKIKTTYPPMSDEIVYCEECYNKEVY